MADLSEKYKDMKIYKEYEPQYLGNTKNRCCIVRIQQATENSPVVVRFQEMYKRKNEETWNYGRHGISIPVNDYIQLCDPTAATPISQDITSMGLANLDREGDDELSEIKPPQAINQHIAYNVFLEFTQDEFVQPWLKWLSQVSDLKNIRDERIQRFDDGVMINNLNIDQRAVVKLQNTLFIKITSCPN